MKVVICGSMTASKEMLKAEEELKKLGHDVILPGFVHDYAAIEAPEIIHKESAKNKIEHDLIREHYKKINDGDAILITNIERKGVPGYIGGNSFLEMGFAHILNKPIYLLNDMPDMGYKDEIEAMSPVVIHDDFSKVQ